MRPLAVLFTALPSTASAAVVRADIVVHVGDQPDGADAPVAGVRAPFAESTGIVGFTGTLADGDGFVFRDDRVIFRYSDDATIAITGGEIAIGTADGDRFVLSADIDGLGIDGLYGDAGLFTVQGTQAPGMPDGTLSTAHARPSMTDAGAIFWVMGVNASGGAATLDRVLATSPDGLPGSTVALLQGGDAIGADTIAHGLDGIDFDYQVSFDGAHVIAVVGLEGGDRAVWLDGIVAREGDPAGVDAWQAFDLVAVDAAGHHAWSGDTDGPASADEVIAYDGAVVLAEGSTVDGVDLPNNAVVDLLSMNDAGAMVHAWSAPALPGVVFYACDPENLALNSRVLIAVGDELDVDGDGTGDAFFVTDFEASAGQPQRALANNGAIFLEVDLFAGETDEAILRLAAPPCCGNLVVESGETCEDGNHDETDDCAQCRTATCGDGFVQAGVEACDDGNEIDDDACTNACTENVGGSTSTGDPSSSSDGSSTSGEDTSDATTDVDDTASSGTTASNATTSSDGSTSTDDATTIEGTSTSTTTSTSTSTGETDTDEPSTGSSSDGCSCRSADRRSVALPLLLLLAGSRRRRRYSAG